MEMKPPFLMIYDYETTSAKPLSTRGVQFAAIGAPLDDDWINTKLQDIHYEITDPEVGVSAEAAAIHGITPEMTAGKRLDKVVAAEFAEQLIELQKSYTVIMNGHYSNSFDFTILKRLSGNSLDGLLHIDTHVAALRTLPNAPNHKLSCTDPKKGDGLIQHLGLGTGAGAHDAMADIRMVWELTKYFCVGLKMTPLQLAQWCMVPRVLQVCHMGKNKGVPWRDVSMGFIYWMINNFEDASPDLRATIYHHFRLKFKN